MAEKKRRLEAEREQRELAQWKRREGQWRAALAAEAEAELQALERVVSEPALRQKLTVLRSRIMMVNSRPPAKRNKYIPQLYVPTSS